MLVGTQNHCSTSALAASKGGTDFSIAAIMARGPSREPSERSLSEFNLYNNNYIKTPYRPARAFSQKTHTNTYRKVLIKIQDTFQWPKWGEVLTMLRIYPSVCYFSFHVLLNGMKMVTMRLVLDGSYVCLSVSAHRRRCAGEMI